MNQLKIFVELLKATFEAWQTDKASRLAAALAYYTVFSIAPLLIITIIIVGLIFGEQAAQNQIATQLEESVGAQAAQFIQGVVASAAKPNSLSLASVISVLTMLMGASGLFAQLQDALNTIWHVEPPPLGVLDFIKRRLVLFGMVCSISMLLLISLFASVIVRAVTNYFHLGSSLQLSSQLISFLIITILFALLYKALPDTHIDWSDVWIGAVVTSVLFTLGNWGIGLYLGSNNVGSAYGAAGSLIVLLVWIYYSAQVFLLGGEFTQVYAHRYGSWAKIPLVEGERVAVPAPTVAPAPFNSKSYVMAIIAFIGGLIIAQIWRPRR